jgi:hypothetical protein
VGVSGPRGARRLRGAGPDGRSVRCLRPATTRAGRAAAGVSGSDRLGAAGAGVSGLRGRGVHQPGLRAATRACRLHRDPSDSRGGADPGRGVRR